MKKGTTTDAAFLETVGENVRALRKRLHLSRRELSERSGISERFLAELEAGKGNISLTRFARVAAALGITPGKLLSAAGEDAQKNAIALLGVRGAGKSTIGAALAKKLGWKFVEVDAEIEKLAGMSLGGMFELHGAPYYRRMEREVLRTVLHSGTPVVLATGGSIVTHPENYALLSERAKTIWLKADAKDHWNRVVDQGDRRPMAQNPQAFTELKALLAARAPLYAAADHVVDTSNRRPSDLVAEICHL
jgi:XRE family aerobic/anaerobic benzoate catabolism transcriptional regulator